MTERNAITVDAIAVEDATLEGRISRALEQVPQVTIPADFATRVAAHAAALPQRKPARQVQYGRTATFVAASVLLVALFALAPFAGSGPASTGFLAEMVVLAQLGALVYWLGRTPREMF